MSIIFYIFTILLANLLSAKIAPLHIGPFLISPGTFTIAASFILRDLVQNRYGKVKTYYFIALALILSAITAKGLGDPMTIVIASACAFAVSESSDTEIYSRLRLPMAWRVWWSGLVGGVLDSGIFVILGLSPLGMGFIPWPFIPMAVLGQALFKIAMQGIGALVIAIYMKGRQSSG
ncbi:MAG: VUT family protein [Desulfotomaculaceae bacterium]|nr:VUT family protein [Desulfotomaculaceae bacterium]